MTQILFVASTAKQIGGIMKFTDLTAVAHVDRDEMSTVIGGDTSFGEFNSDRIVAAGVGRAQLLGVQALEVRFDVTNLGQLIQAAEDSIGGGLPGNNGAKYFFSQTTVPDMKVPAGLV